MNKSKINIYVDHWGLDPAYKYPKSTNLMNMLDYVKTGVNQILIE